MAWSLIRQAAVAMALLLSLGDAPLPTARPEEVGLSTDRLQRIHEMVMRRIEAKELSGAVTIVARRGRVVHYEANGLMDIESRKPMGKDTLFHLASSTKPITAVAVLILLEEGKLKLTDPVSKYIPEFKNPKVLVESSSLPEPMADSSPSANKTYLVPADRDITILDLLTHTSGLASGGIAGEEFAKLRQESRKPTKTLADFIPRLGALPLDFQPGTKWRYSPIAAFDTLGRIVEIVSGMTFDQFLRTRLLEPLGMSNTFFQVSEKDQSRVATIYEQTEHGLEKPTEPWDVFPLYFSGSGGLVSTAADYLRFAQMLCNGGSLTGNAFSARGPWTSCLATM